MIVDARAGVDNLEKMAIFGVPSTPIRTLAATVAHIKHRRTVMTDPNITPDPVTPEEGDPTPETQAPENDPFAQQTPDSGTTEFTPPWAQEPQQGVPSAQEDAEIRDQRARRFGADPASESAPEAMTQEGGEPPTEIVTPIPAAPAAGYSEPAPATGSPSPFPATTQMPASPVETLTYDDAFTDLDEGPTSRAAAHWWTILITLVFAPVGWYLFTDGGVRIAWGFDQGSPITVASYVQFGLGLLALFIFLLAARWSSVGSIIFGSISLALGVTYLVFPSEAGQFMTDTMPYFGRLGQFGVNLAEHLTSTLQTGHMAVYGLVMIMVGVVSHGARRQGRREERANIALGQ